MEVDQITSQPSHLKKEKREKEGWIGLHLNVCSSPLSTKMAGTWKLTKKRESILAKNKNGPDGQYTKAIYKVNLLY